MIFYDFEVFERDWLAVFIDVTNQKEHVIINDKDKLRTLYERNMSNIWVGFNNRHYDQYIMKGILLGLDPKKINDWIIIQGKEGWQYSRVFNKLPMILMGIGTASGNITIQDVTSQNRKLMQNMQKT